MLVFLKPESFLSASRSAFSLTGAKSPPRRQSIRLHDFIEQLQTLTILIWLPVFLYAVSIRNLEKEGKSYWTTSGPPLT